MIALHGDLKILVATQPIDFRKGSMGLSRWWLRRCNPIPIAGRFLSSDRNAMTVLRMLAYDGSGIVLVSKWLEAGRFTWPPIREGAVRLSASKMAMLLDGLDWTRVAQPEVKRPITVG